MNIEKPFCKLKNLAHHTPNTQKKANNTQNKPRLSEGCSLCARKMMFG